MIPFLLAGLVSASAWWGWSTHRLRYSPDFELYTQGGLGIYPSPIGRAIGASGEPVMVGLSILSAGLVVLLVYKAAGSVWASLAVFLSPVTLYLGHAGIDPIGLAFYTAALAGVLPVLFLPAAGATHLSLVPFVLLELVRSKRLGTLPKAVLAFFMLPAVAVVLLVTPYGGIVTALDAQAFAQGLGAGLLIALPAIALYRFSLYGCLGFILGALECAAQHHLQARYLLPAVLLHIITGRLRAWPLRFSAYCESLRWRLLEMGASGGARDSSTLTAKQEGLAP